MAGRHIVAAAAVGACLLIPGAWLERRVNKFGLNDTFSREHSFSDQ